MNEVGSAPVASKKRNITLWPSIVTVVLIFGSWVFLYNDIVWFLLWVGINFFWRFVSFASCIRCSDENRRNACLF